MQRLFMCILLRTLPAPPSLTLFPYTTLFRSGPRGRRPGPTPPPGGGRPSLAADFGQRQDALELALHHGMLVDRKSTRLNSSHRCISYAVFCLKKKIRVPGLTPFSESSRDYPR